MHRNHWSRINYNPTDFIRLKVTPLPFIRMKVSNREVTLCFSKLFKVPQVEGQQISMGTAQWKGVLLFLVIVPVNLDSLGLREPDWWGVFFPKDVKLQTAGMKSHVSWKSESPLKACLKWAVTDRQGMMILPRVHLGFPGI